MSRYEVGLELGWSWVGVRLEFGWCWVGVGLGLQGPGRLGLGLECLDMVL